MIIDKSKMKTNIWYDSILMIGLLNFKRIDSEMMMIYGDK